jgi:hypothetical protein
VSAVLTRIVPSVVARKTEWCEQRLVAQGVDLGHSRVVGVDPLERIDAHSAPR